MNTLRRAPSGLAESPTRWKSRTAAYQRALASTSVTVRPRWWIRLIVMAAACRSESVHCHGADPCVLRRSHGPDNSRCVGMPPGGQAVGQPAENVCVVVEAGDQHCLRVRHWNPSAPSRYLVRRRSEDDPFSCARHCDAHHVEGRCRGYSILRATCSASSRENSCSPSHNARSIPLVTPPLVTRSPSSTTRCLTSVAPVAARSSHAL